MANPDSIAYNFVYFGRVFFVTNPNFVKSDLKEYLIKKQMQNNAMPQAMITETITLNGNNRHPTISK